MALDKFEQGEYPTTTPGAFYRYGCHRGHAYCFEFRKYKGVRVFAKRTDGQTEMVFADRGFCDQAMLHTVAASKIDIFIKQDEQRRARTEALDAFTRQCREYRPGGYCHKYPPYKCATCRCHPKHEFLWDYDEKHGLMHTFG